MTRNYDEKKRKKVMKNIATGRLGNQEELTKAIKFAFENQFSNGGAIDLNGGLSYD